MLDLWKRWIQFHELKLESDPIEAPYIHISDAIPLLLDRISKGDAVKLINNEHAALRISKARHYTKQNVLMLLLQYADKSVTDPAFQHLEKGTLRTEPKLDGEGVAVSAHVAISLEPHDDVGIMYHFLLEEIPGLGRSRISPFIKSELKAATDGVFTYQDPENNSRVRPYKPDAEILGVPSKKLLAEWDDGVILQGIELVKLTPDTSEFDEEGFYTEASRHIKIVPDNGSDSSLQNIIERIQVKASAAGYDDIKIRYKRTKGKQKTTVLGTTQSDLADALIIRDEEVTADEVLGQCMQDISDSIAKQMINFILEMRNSED